MIKCVYLSFLILLQFFTILISLLLKITNRMNRRYAWKAAKKFQHFNKDKNDQLLMSDNKVFRVHNVVQSQAQILLPKTYLPNKFKDLMAMILHEQQQIWVQITDNSFNPQIKQISILHNILSLRGIQTDKNNQFQGTIKFVSKDKIPQNYYLQYAEFLVKDVYLSRRDQYKILRNLQKQQIHVYTRKTLYFDKLKLQVTNLLLNNNEIGKTGMISHKTKIIFRSACSKYTLLVEISKQMFQLNHEKELYIEKSIQFLILFLLRNNYFQTKHRIQIILYARLFYPQYETLEEAYNDLKAKGYDAIPKDNHENLYFDERVQESQNNFSVNNFAVAFQKDYQGRIYQDVYRKILWLKNSVVGFRETFWERVSEFLFTINWINCTSYAKIIRSSMQESIQTQRQYFPQDKFSNKMRPFIHALECQLSKSEQSCYFEAISLVSQQYKHHYYFRSLKQTGNAITIISAGKSHYIVDETTYKMTKSNIYLTNINCIHLNMRWKKSLVTTEIICLKNKPYYKRNNDIYRLQRLIDWCREQDAYISPMNNTIDFPTSFELKSMIFPEQLFAIEKQQYFPYLPHFCEKSEHYSHKQQLDFHPNYSIKQKNVHFIEAYHLSQQAYCAHEYFYGSQKFNHYQYPPLFDKKRKWKIQPYGRKKNKRELQIFQMNSNNNTFETDHYTEKQQNQLKQIEEDFQIIINKKNKYRFENIGMVSQISQQVQNYVQDCLSIREQEDEICWNRNDEKDKMIVKNNSFRKKQRQQKIELEQQLVQTVFTIGELDKYDFQSKQQLPATPMPNKKSSIKLAFSVQRMLSEDNIQSRNMAFSCDISTFKEKDYRRKASQIIPEEQQMPREQEILYQLDEKNRKKLNIFEQTKNRLVYVVNKHQSETTIPFKLPKNMSHNKQRLKSNYPACKIHYLNSFISETNAENLEKFVKSYENNNYNNHSYYNSQKLNRQFLEYIEIQKQWKNIIFPILTPIYTQFKTNENNQSFNVKQSETGKYAVEQQICKYLMDNFQIQSQSFSSKMNLSKGHVHVQLSITSEVNVATFQAVDIVKQNKIIPKMLYRYLSYEQKDYRFGCKSIAFSDSNFYEDDLAKDKKSVKIAIIPFNDCSDLQSKVSSQAELQDQDSPQTIKQAQSQSASDYSDSMAELGSIRRLISQLQQKYREIKLKASDIILGQITNRSKTYKTQINLVSDQKNNKIYFSQIIQVTIDTQLCTGRIFNIIIQWDYCCATYINQFIVNLINLARKNKLKTHLVSRDHAFNTKWTISTTGEIVFSSMTAMEILFRDITKNHQWIWDSEGYFMNINGSAFIRFIEDKNLIEWRDNNSHQQIANFEKATQAKKIENTELFHKFFMVSAAYDFLGSIIDNITVDIRRNRHSSLTFST